MKKVEESNRRVYIDYLRVFATFAIMILHVSAKNLFTIDVSSSNWQILSIYNSVVRWGVAIFVMISGTLFLNKDIPIKKIYLKYILRMVLSFGFWAFIYAIFAKGTILSKISVLIEGKYHMWFIPMIIGIYMSIPMIKTIVRDEKVLNYYLILFLLFGIIIPSAIVLIKDLGNGIIIKGINALDYDIRSLDVHLVLGFCGYFVLGYYLDKKTFTEKQKKYIYILGLLGFSITIGMTLMLSLKTQHYFENYHGNFMLNILLESVAVFIFFKSIKYNNKKINNIMQKLSKYSYGAFLMHVLIMDQINERLRLTTLSFNPIISVLVITLIVFVISFGISALLNHIPIVKKYLV